jgi:putative RNA 2'-phosphotransferase
MTTSKCRAKNPAACRIHGTVENKNHDVKISKRLSYVLRHKPESVGLELDSAGWVELEELSKATGYTKAEIKHVVKFDGKQRYALKNGKIRASQGHSTKVELEYETAEPPTILYHGTSAAVLGSIFQQGLIKGKRHAVHLSGDIPTAQAVASRRSGETKLLKVDAKAMHDAGYKFQRSANGVWLTETVPAKFLGLVS